MVTSPEAMGREVARHIIAEARETFPNDFRGQTDFIWGYVSNMGEQNIGTNGKPYAADFWRGLFKTFRLEHK